MSGAGEAKASSLQEELTELALSGRGWSSILRRLTEATGASARLLGVHGGVLAAAPDDDVAGVAPEEIARFADTAEPATLVCADGWLGSGIGLRAGSRRVGVLAIEEPLGARERAALLDARVAVCIEAVRRDTEAEARAETASRLIEEVRFGSLRDPDEVARSAARFGLALDRPHVAAVFAYEGERRRTWATALRWIEMPVLHDRGRGWTVLEPDESEISRIRTRIQGMIGDDAPVLAATGSVVNTVGDTARSFQEAEVILEVLRRRGDRVQLDHGSLGLSSVLISVLPDRLRAFIDAQLGPILDRPDLVETLVAWLGTNGSRAAVAERLFIHRNSVGYRVARLRDLLGVDPLDPATTLDLRAALAAREVLGALEDIELERSGPAGA